METQPNWVTSIDRIIDMGLSHGLAQRTTEDEVFNGRTICLNGRHVLNFALCSYLELEQDSRLKQGTIDAVTRYGTQFAISRAYMSATPYTELEVLLEELFEGHVLATPTTTLGHIAALPVLIQKRRCDYHRPDGSQQPPNCCKVGAGGRRSCRNPASR